MSDAPTLADLIAAWDLFRDPMVCGAIAGAVLGYLSVYVLLRRMVFVSAAVTQSAGLGVALSFYAGIHWGLAIDPIAGAALLSLATTGESWALKTVRRFCFSKAASEVASGSPRSCRPKAYRARHTSSASSARAARATMRASLQSARRSASRSTSTRSRSSRTP